MTKARWVMALTLSASLAACDSDPFVPEGVPTKAVVARIDVGLGAVELFPGDTTSVVARALTPDGEPVLFLDFSWQVSDSTVASVEVKSSTERAIVTALAIGTASLTAKVGGVSSSPILLEIVPDTTQSGS